MKQILALAALLSTTPALADPPEILAVTLEGPRISVTLLHGDTGWDHYADGWQVFDHTGAPLGTRVLHHPHVAEQPFTRALGLETAPNGPWIEVIAKDNYGDKSAPYRLDLP